MTLFDLTQEEADRLMAAAKKRQDEKGWPYPTIGASTTIPLVSEDEQDEFLLDINRGRISVTKVTFQNRCYATIPLVRLDIEGPDHPNPDGEIIPCPHVHIFREGWGDRWATPADPENFPNTTDGLATLFSFMDYCNVVERPLVLSTLF